MTALSVAIEKRQWQVVSLYLLLGVSDAASRLPPESLSALIDLLGEGSARKTRRRAEGTRGGKAV